MGLAFRLPMFDVGLFCLI